MRDDAMVKNAADPEQVKNAVTKTNLKRDDELNDLRYLLTLPQFRRFVWRLLKFCKVFETIWSPSALIHYNSGQQDVGHFVTAEVVSADPEALVKMMVENKKGE